jgi:hypothetical protein
MPTLAARQLSISIEVPFDRAYAYARQPAHFADWAAGLADTLRHTERGWVADTPQGEAAVEFSQDNAFGVLDHRVRLPGQPEILIPLRMIANGDGTEVLFTLFRQPQMDDAAFEHDAGLVMRDLESLKRKLEQG